MGRSKSSYKEGDQVMIFVNPNTNTCAEGLAILKEFIESDKHVERWSVEFLDQPGKTYPRFISKPHMNRYDESPYRFAGDWGPLHDTLVAGSNDVACVGPDYQALER
jgi:hypothetical protein